VCERVLQEPALGELTNWRIGQFVNSDSLLVHFSDSSGISKTLTIPLDAKLNGKQLRYYVSTPDSNENDVKLATKVRVVFTVQTENTWKYHPHFGGHFDVIFVMESSIET
jgi:hypothetical protein